MKQTKVQLFEGPTLPLRCALLPLPEQLADGEVLVRIELATICGSDLHTICGARTEPTPAVLGHEGVGRIIRTGQGREDVAIGQRVTWSITDTCGECVFCREYNLPQKCVRLFKYGHARISDGSGLNGCYAEHILLRPGTRIVPLPDALPDAVAAPANCALATMVEAVAALPDGCRSVLVQGAGMLGLYGCALLRERGVRHVFCTDVNPHRLAMAEAFGAVPIDARPEHYPMHRSKLEEAAPHGLDVVIEAAGAAEAVPEGIALLRAGGHYQLVGLVHPHSQLQITGEQLIRKCLTIRGTHNYHPDRLAEAVAFLDRTVGRYPYDRLVSPPFPLSRLQDAIEAAKSQQWPRVAVAPDS